MKRSDAAHGVHHLVLLHGRERAREMVDAKTTTAGRHRRRSYGRRQSEDRHLLYGLLSDQPAAQEACPMTRPGKRRAPGHALGRAWPHESPEAGLSTYGVPYGARARMILLYLQTQAVRTGSREVALGRSMRDWMERMGLAIGGETARSLREQAARISACTLKFFWEEGEREGWTRGAIVSSGLRFKIPERQQGSLWEDRVVLDEMFWKALRDHPVPLLEAAIRQLRDRSMSLDIYVWLAWRLHQIGSQRRFPGRRFTRSSGPASRQSSISSLLSRKHWQPP